MWGFSLKWWQYPLFALVLFPAILWRTPQFWIAILVVVLLGYGGCQAYHHLTWAP